VGAPVVALLIGGPQPTSADTEGTIRQVGTVPNYFWTHRPANNPDPATFSRSTSSFADPQNRLLFQFNGSGCTGGDTPNLVAMDVDSYKVVATDLRTAGTSPMCTEDGGGGSGAFDVPAPQGAAPPPTVAVDSQDGLLIGALAAGNALNGSSIAVLKESSLDFVAHWSLPSTLATKNIFGLTWYAPTDELVVLTSNGNTSTGSPPPGVTVSVYKIADALHMGTGTLTPIWSQNVSQCQFTMVPVYGTAAAYRSVHSSTMFVPCQLFAAGKVGVGTTRVGIVALQLGNTDPVTGAGCDACPNGKVDIEVAPGLANDLFFDPGGDRGFMPQQGSDQMSAMVYDGSGGVGGKTPPSFLGKTSLGDGSSALIGLDQSTGRVYSVTDHGMTLIDGRRTPVSPGVFRSDLAQPVLAGSTVILPPDGLYPFTRVLVLNLSNYTGLNTGEEHDYKVYADAYAVTQDPPASNVDSNTVSGAVPPGATVNSIVNSTARGYGFHVDMVAGTQGTLNNAYTSFQVTGVPLGHSYRDVLGASVNRVALANGSTAAQASALADGNGVASFEVSQCSNTNALGNCAPPPQPPCNALTNNGLPCPAVPAAPTASPAPSGSPTPSASPTTTQPWPFPDALCTEPGSTSPSADADGLVANSNPSAAQPSPATAPGTDKLGAAHAHVSCVGDGKYFPGGVNANALLGSPAGDGVVGVASATTSSAVFHRNDISGIESDTTSEAKGVTITLPGGAILQIGDVVHTAKAVAGGYTGSATTTNTVSIANVSITTPGSSNATEVCSNQCDPRSLAASVNAQFPYLLQILYPTPAAPFGLDKDGNPLGSPGGYEGIVQASPTQMYGDEQFNGMSAEEASLLPAMRIVVYGYNDGNPNQSRLVVDLAGAENDAQLGLQVASAPPPPIDTTNPVIDTNAAAAGAGVAAFLPGSSGGGNPLPPGVTAPYVAPPGLLGVAMRAFQGLLWMVRSPGDGLRMAAFLALLATPVMLMRRRWTWTDTSTRRGG